MSTQPDTYTRILEAARDLIYASSYADVGVQAICEKAEVKKGSFYHFFPSKQELTLAVIDNYYEGLKDSILREAFSASLSPAERFQKLFELTIARQELIHQQTGHVLGCPFGNLATELATSDEAIRCKIEGLFGRLQELMRETLVEAVAREKIEDLDIDATAEGMFAYFEGVMLLAKTKNDPAVLRKLLPATAQLRIHNIN